MWIEYHLADGQEIKYHIDDYTGPSLDDIERLAMMYAEKRPNDLPTDIFMHVSVYSVFIKSLSLRVSTIPVDSGVQVLQINTGCGPLKVHAMPWAFQGFKMLVGKREDYDRYDIDKVFEDVVLKDCERE
jgi:hypothetical protein